MAPARARLSQSEMAPPCNSVRERSRSLAPRTIQILKKLPHGELFQYLLRGQELHLRPQGYEPCELLLLHPAHVNILQISSSRNVSRCYGSQTVYRCRPSTGRPNADRLRAIEYNRILNLSAKRGLTQKARAESPHVLIISDRIL